MGSDATCVGRVAAPVSVCTTSNAIIAVSVTVPLSACTTSDAQRAGRAGAPRSASMTSGVNSVGRAVLPLSVRTIRNAAVALNAKTSHAPFKGAYSLAIASAAHKNY